MTPERIEQERAKFEKNIPESGITNYKQRLRSGEYAYDHIEFAWEMWQARAAQSEWISVEERLPETETSVLVFTERGYIFLSWASNEDVFWFYNEDENDRVTHWQPLPAPPTTDPDA